MTKDYIAPPDPLRLIKNVRFVDTPREEFEPNDCLIPKDDEPYIPNGAEWRNVEKLIRTVQTVAATGVLFGVVALLVSVASFAIK